MTSAGLVLLLSGCLVHFVSAQEDLPDSITSTDCQTLAMSSSHVCCDPNTGNFCELQCNNGFCMCVDPITGERTTDETFSENEEGITCSLIFVGPPSPDPPENPTTTEVTTTEVTTTEVTTTEVTITEELTTVPPEVTTEIQTTTAAEPERPLVPEIVTTIEAEVEERPTTDCPPEEEDDDDSDSTSTQRSSRRSGSSRSTGRSGSKSTGTTTGTSRSTGRSTARSGSTTTRYRCGSRTKPTGTSRSTGRSRSTRTGTTRTGTNRTRSDTTGRSGSTRRSGTTSTSRTGTTGRTGTTRMRCPTVRSLLSQDCVYSCIVEGSDGCPACNLTCLNQVTSDPSAEETLCNCAVNQMCLRVGRFGEPKCVDLLREGDRCDERRNDDSDEEENNNDERTSRTRTGKSDSYFDESSHRSARRKVGGARDRRVYGNLNDATVGCQEGLVCTRVNPDRSECRPQNGPCVTANQGSQEFECTPDGNFEPLQCQLIAGNLLTCVCVNPSSGRVISGTETTVASRDDAPDCDRLIGCTILRGDQTFNVDHGDFFVDVENCQRCLCNNGEATSCESSVCTALQRVPPGCTYRGRSYRHGDSLQIGCNQCGCRNGELRCTRQQCERSKVRDKCQECMSEPVEQVCGINGLTYPSSCAAKFCAGLAPFDFVQGNCPSVNICRVYPCKAGEKCIHRGGATCFDANGCDPDDLRLCVDLNSLVCENQEQPDDDSTAVCGTNGVTYPSLCRLIQDTGNEAVAHAGPCNREECDGGQVCGTDGVTYENVCILRAQSANARLDYYGECETGPGDSHEEICERVTSKNRCIYNTSNCRYLVTPEEGCCALCGGVVFVAVDFAGLRDYVRINPRVRTLDSFIEVLVDSGFISDEITERCRLEVSFTITRNIQIALSAKEDEHSKFCNDAGERLAAAINDPSSVSDDPRFTEIPEVIQFASAAVAAPNLVAIVDEVNGGSNGALHHTSATSQVTVLLVITLLTFTLL